MEQISLYLKRFQDVALKEESFFESVRSVIEKECGAIVPAESISRKGNTLYISVHPILKTEIYLKKDRIMASLEKILGSGGPKKLV